MSQGSQDISQQFIGGGVIPGQLVGQEAVSKTYVDGQNAGLAGDISNVAASAAAAQGAINMHEASPVAHSAAAITYNGAVGSANNVRQALDNTKQRVDNIVASAGDSNTEIVDARQPASGVAWPVLGARLNDVDQQLSETVSGIVNVVKKYGAIGDGVYHPLSERFPTLVTAQMRYPHATSLTDSIDWAAIQGALNENQSVYVPRGRYMLSEPAVMTLPHQALRGNSKEDTIFEPTSNFVSRTRDSITVGALVWYHKGTDWVEGGEISGLRLICNAVVDGIYLYGVANGNNVRDIYIYRPLYGIHNAHNGWGNNFENVFVVGAVTTSIRLANFANGNTVTNCYLYGKDWNTLTHLHIDNACFGVSVIGGFIEGCDVGARIHNQAQVTFIGVDFEVCQLLFIQSVGSYDGPVLQFPNPPSFVSGCTLVGVPSQGGINVNGGMMTVNSNNFIINGVDSGTIPCLIGTGGGTIFADGVEQPCISEYDNDFTSWKVKTSGKVFNRMSGINAASSAVSKLIVGKRSARLSETQGWNTELTGQTRAANQFGLSVPLFNTDTPTLTLLGLGDRTRSLDPEDYVWNNLSVETASLRFTSNLQSETGPFPTYGKAKLMASVTTTAGKNSDYGIVADSILQAVVPTSDNSVKLGASGHRWSELWAANGTIQTSDLRAKTDIKDSDLGLGFISKLRPVSYKMLNAKTVTRENLVGYKEVEVYKDEDGKPIIEKIPQYETEIVESVPGVRPHYGLIAQEVKSTLDDLSVADFAGYISDSETGELGLRYEEFIAPLIKAVQELSAEVKELRSKVDS